MSIDVPSDDARRRKLTTRTRRQGGIVACAPASEIESRCKEMEEIGARNARPMIRQLLPREPDSRTPHSHATTAAGLRAFGRFSLVESSYWTPLPKVFDASVLMASVVPNYRCGAAPELTLKSHRIPS
jgi:hypothetical protein